VAETVDDAAGPRTDGQDAARVGPPDERQACNWGAVIDERAVLGSLMAGVDLDRLRILPRRPARWADAACRGRPDVNFFPGRGGKTTPAKALCAGCASSAPCLAFALADHDLQGIWAGTTAADRKEFRRRRAAA
jgi:WhiB family redox-sensing transcriptional regulator